MSLSQWIAEGEEAKARARRSADIEMVRSLDPDVYAPLGPEPCAHPKDALGCCTGPCAGEDWER